MLGKAALYRMWIETSSFWYNCWQIPSRRQVNVCNSITCTRNMEVLVRLVSGRLKWTGALRVVVNT